jgi:hypothetical protein
MITSKLSYFTEVERRKRALNHATTRSLCNTLLPLIGRPNFADVMQRPSAHYRVLKWLGNQIIDGDPVRAALTAVPDGAFSFNENGLRVIVNRSVKKSAWQQPYDKITARAKARVTIARNRLFNASKKWSRPDPNWDNTFGWRIWAWNGKQLCSPTRGTIWPEDGILEADFWPETEQVLRGHAGIHATVTPVDWKQADRMHNVELLGRNHVDGIVERFGRAVIGDNGWRAERAVIRQIRAPSTEIGLAIEHQYPGVEVFYPEYLVIQQEDNG